MLWMDGIRKAPREHMGTKVWKMKDVKSRAHYRAWNKGFDKISWRQRFGRELCHLEVGGLREKWGLPRRLTLADGYGEPGRKPFPHTCLEVEKHYFLFQAEDSH